MQYYNGISKGYDELYGTEQSRKYEAIATFLQEKTDGFCLDVGCGTGIGSAYFTHYIGVDPSSKLIDIAKKNYDPIFLVGGASNLSMFDSNSFDLLLCVTCMHHFKDLYKFLQEAKRVTKKNAMFGFSVLQTVDSFHEISSFIKEEFEIVKEIPVLNDVVYICCLQKF